jgi:hypothetical protein
MVFGGNSAVYIGSYVKAYACYFTVCIIAAGLLAAGAKVFQKASN